jgi:hypothetical protein
MTRGPRTGREGAGRRPGRSVGRAQKAGPRAWASAPVLRHFRRLSAAGPSPGPLADGREGGSGGTAGGNGPPVTTP